MRYETMVCLLCHDLVTDRPIKAERWVFKCSMMVRARPHKCWTPSLSYANEVTYPFTQAVSDSRNQYGRLRVQIFGRAGGWSSTTERGKRPMSGILTDHLDYASIFFLVVGWECQSELPLRDSLMVTAFWSESSRSHS